MIEAFHGLHQANVAFLNQIRKWQSVARKSPRNGNHVTQMRKHQLPSSLKIVVGVITPGKRFLFFSA